MLITTIFTTVCAIMFPQGRSLEFGGKRSEVSDKHDRFDHKCSSQPKISPAAIEQTPKQAKKQKEVQTSISI